MKLTLSKREGNKKSELTRLRYAGDIPAVLYKKGEHSELLIVKGEEFAVALRGMVKGHLPTTHFELEWGGRKEKAIVKEIQYHPTTYAVLHLDFHPLEEGKKVTVNVPVLCVGEADCVGVKLGGFVRLVKRHLRVRCPSNAIPSHFELNIQELAIGQSKKISDIQFGEEIQLVGADKEIVVTIAKR